jgi:hypothetical protein
MSIELIDRNPITKSTIKNINFTLLDLDFMSWNVSFLLNEEILSLK